MFYRTEEELFDAVVPYLAFGLNQGEKCIYVADETPVAKLKKAMGSFGINVRESIRTGQLAILGKEDAYLKPGHFNPDWMIDFLKSAVGDATAQGLTIRAAGEMTWALGGEPGTDLLSEYESKLNDFFPHHDILGMCLYNLNRFPSHVINDMLRTHPLIVTESVVCHNYYYRPPEKFTPSQKDETHIDGLLKALQADEKMNNVRRLNNQKLAKEISGS